MTVNPANIEHILKKNFENYEKGEFMKTIFHDFLGDGIFNADGEQWKVQRKVASNIFNVSSIDPFFSFLFSLFFSVRDSFVLFFVAAGQELP